ncbi:MAG: hypothetical protein RMI30_04965, partial [Thermodesulfovibrio sp.]|nr:hypothetical protein [Thermodesulfovibrio sp.]
MVDELKRIIKRMKRKIFNYIKKYRTLTHLDGMIDGIIFGWIICEKDINPIEVLVNGKEILKFEQTLPAPEIHPNAYRFSIDLNKYSFSENDEICLIFNRKKIKGMPITLKKDLLFAKIDTFSGYECIGWAGSPFGDIPELKVVINEETVETNFEWFIREDFKRLSIKVPTGFKFKIPEKFLDGDLHKIYLVNPFTNQKLCKEKEFRFKVKNFYIDKADSDVIAGWIQIEDYPGPVDLSIYI